jgi:glycosyltransferase involved in cell wall biosynthesis
MKILLTGFQFDTIGGLEIVSANIAHTLVDAGHDVQCAAVHGRGASRKNGYQIVGLLPENRLLRSAAVRMQRFYPRKKLRELIAWADVIIACHCHTLPLVYRCLDTAATSPPVVAWLHGLEVWGQYGEDYAEDLQQLLGTAYRPTVVHNSIDTEFFRPSATHEIERLSILTVGRHDSGTESKGYDMLIDALALIRRRSPALPLSLRITGDGPLLSTLRAKAEALGVGGMVGFTGKVSKDELRRLYATSDVFAFPSRLKRRGNTIHGEGFGVVNIEAAACGRPVLTSTHGGCPETILDGVTGILVDPTSVEAVAAGLEQMFRMTPAERDAMGQRGRQHVLEQFSHATLSQKLTELLDGLTTC